MKFNPSEKCLLIENNNNIIENEEDNNINKKKFNRTPHISYRNFDFRKR